MKASMELAFKKALETSAQEFVSLVSQHQSRGEKSIVKSLLSKCSVQSAAEICDALASTTELALVALNSLPKQQVDHVVIHPSSSQSNSKPKQGTRSRRARGRERAGDTPAKSMTDSPGDEISGRETEENAQLGQARNTLHCCAFLANVSLTEAMVTMQPGWLFPTVLRLHDSLVQLDSDPNLQESIAGLCEVWWREDLEGKESLIVQCVPFLLSKALAWGRKKDVQRLYGMRNALLLFDFYDESIEDMKHLLIRTVVTPAFFRTQPGRRFVSFLFGLDPQLVKELVVIVRSQIPFGRKSILEAYAEILYQAWKTAEGPCLHEIEVTCIQGLFEAALFARTRALGTSVRTVLEGFAAQKAQDGVESMLFRVLEPVLFRALQAASSNVRQNALLVLVDVFPLEDPDTSNEEKEAVLEKQFGLLEKLLIDPCPDVRSVAVQVVCRILRLFWEVIPSAVTVKFLTKVVEDLGSDATSNAVRLAVLQGIAYLLENARSHAILKAMIPSLGALLNDCCLSVRVAAADLLLVIKGIRVFDFFKVVHIKTLLSSLATDNASVAQRLTRLILPSYFPPKVAVKEACKRCVVLLKRSPQAGAQFCKWLLLEGASPESLLELVQVLSSLAKEELTEEVRAGIFLALSEVCQSLMTVKACKTIVGDMLNADVVESLVGCAPDSLARSYVLQIASSLPPKDVSKLVLYCCNLARNDTVLPDDEAEVSAVHSLILAWGGFDCLLDALISLLSGYSDVAGNGTTHKVGKGRVRPTKPKIQSTAESAWPNVLDSSVTKKSHSRTCTAKDKFIAAAGAAWQVESLLTGNETRLAVLRNNRLKELLQALRRLAQIFIQRPGEGSPFLSSTCHPRSPILAYMKLHLHIRLEISEASEQALKKAIKSRQGQSKLSHPTSGLDELSCEFETSCEELVGWLREMLTKGSQTQTPLTSPPPSQPKAKYARRYGGKLRQREPLSPLSPNIPTGSDVKAKDNANVNSMLNNWEEIAAICAQVLQTIADAFSLGLMKNMSARQESAKLVTDFVQWLSLCCSRIKGKEHQLAAGLKQYWTFAKVITTYAAKCLSLYLQDTSSDLGDGRVLAHSLLDLFAVLESLKRPKSQMPLFGTSLQQWIPDVLIAISSFGGHAVCDDVTKEQPRQGPGGPLTDDSPISQQSTASLEYFRPWVSHLATQAFEALELAESSTCASNSSIESLSTNSANISPGSVVGNEAFPDKMDLIDTIVNYLHKGHVQVLSDFVAFLIRFSVFSFAQRDYRATVGSLQLICERLLMLRNPEQKGPSVLKESSLINLREMSSSVNTALESSSSSPLLACRRQLLEVASSLLRTVLSRHGGDVNDL